MAVLVAEYTFFRAFGLPTVMLLMHFELAFSASFVAVFTLLFAGMG